MKEISPFDQLKREVVLFQKKFGDSTINVKPLSLTRDIPVIHRWVNMEYAKAFWQMEGTYAKLYAHYEKAFESGFKFSLVFFIDQQKTPVALMDVYHARHDEIAQHYECAQEDFGLHLLMGPRKKHIPGLTDHVLQTGLSFLFTLSIDRVFGEPDIENKKANELIKRAGFRFLKEIHLSYKKANLYCCDKKDFYKNHPLE